MKEIFVISALIIFALIMACVAYYAVRSIKEAKRTKQMTREKELAMMKQKEKAGNGMGRIRR